jgi:hypothetical protein
MTKRPAFLALAAAALLTAGCADAPEPAQRPNAAELDRLVATVEAQAAAANAPTKVPDQIASADRIAGTVARLPAEKIDPNLVASALAR